LLHDDESRLIHDDESRLIQGVLMITKMMTKSP